MHSYSRALFCILSLMLAVGCEDYQKNLVTHEATHNELNNLAAIEAAEEPTVEAKESILDVDPDELLPPMILPPPSNVYLPIYGGGGGGGRSRPSCRDCTAGLDDTCQIGFCNGSGGCQTIDLAGPYGAACTTDLPGICAEGRMMCLDGVLTNTCEPLVIPGAEQEFCNSAGDVNCDGETNICNCPVPPDGSIRRYVDPVAGSDIGNCKNPKSPCKTIVYSISKANSGDTLVLAAGTFLETNIEVNKNLFIFGQEQGVSIVQADGTNRVFMVDPNVEAAFCGLTITGGNAVSSNGGGILVNGSATITSSTISNNSAVFGGSIYNGSGLLTISDSTLSNNTSAISGGSIYNTSGTITINNSTLSGNSASTFISKDGGSIYNTSGTITITDSTVSGNSAANLGGGIYHERGTLTIAGSIITNNSSGSGGGMVNLFGTLIINDSTVSNNSVTTNGGGIYNNSMMTITNSTINGNSCSGPNSGGGIVSYSSSTIAITNSTISGNSCNQGGGIYSLRSNITISNSTITKNNGGGILNLNVFSTIPIKISGSIVADQFSGDDCSGSITNNGFNLDKDSSCTGFNHVSTFTLPLITNNGGPTETHALVAGGAGSQAIDAGDTSCGVTTDQRGEPRPVNYLVLSQAHCDIGAYELQAP